MTDWNEAMLAEAKALGAATLHEAAGRIGALPSAIKPVVPDMRVAGPAFTVIVPAFDNLGIHRALYRAKPGDVLVVATNDGIEAGYWGDILNIAAMTHGLAGLVINGGVRDTGGLAVMDFPVFSNGICIRGTIKGFDQPQRLQEPVAIGNVVINPGDLIVGDRDGVVAIPRARFGEVIEKGKAREADETAKIERIRAGERTIDIYGFGEG